jgi:hypothetical protein
MELGQNRAPRRNFVIAFLHLWIILPGTWLTGLLWILVREYKPCTIFTNFSGGRHLNAEGQEMC